MKDNICIKGTDAVYPLGISKTDVYLRDGRIEAVLPADAPLLKGYRVIDGRNKILIPGMIDTHTHLRAPAQAEHEDFLSGTEAACCGGVTTIFEMPICGAQPVNCAESLNKRRKTAKKSSYVNIGFYGGAGIESLPYIIEQAEAGAIAFKTFMCRPSAGREAEMSGLWGASRSDLWQVFIKVAETGKVLAVHAEDDEIILRTSYDSQAIDFGRPQSAEINAVSNAVALAKASGLKLVICHLSTAEGLEIVKKAQKDGQKVFLETCMHYLLFSEEETRKFGAYAKIKPPLRDISQRDKLFTAMRQGSIDVIGSDHAPYIKEWKERGFSEAPYGIPGIELSLRLMVDLALQGILDWSCLVELTSHRAAEIFSLRHKGFIGEGADADLVLIDPSSEYTVDLAKLRSKSAQSAVIYKGRKLKGDISHVFVKGVLMLEEGRFTGKGFFDETRII